MFKLIFTVFIVAVVAGAYFLYTHLNPDPVAYSVDDFVNEERVLADPAVSEEERSARAEQIEASSAPEEGEDPYDAARSTMEAYLDAGLYGEALRVGEEIEVNYELTASYFELKGDVLVEMEQYRDAAEAYGRALDLEEKRVSTYLRFAELYLRHSQNTQVAVSFYERAKRFTENSELREDIEDRIESIITESF
jgi:tetratricopeptide (TPR) repeat protein